MTKIHSVKLLWDKWNTEHIKKHKVTFAEVEEAYKNRKTAFTSYLGRKVITGKTRRGRLITFVVSYTMQKNPYIVSARDASVKERRIYNEKTKTN